MKVLVTGAAGFIGSHVSEKLLQSGFQVTGLDNFDPYYNPNQKLKNLQILHEYPRFLFHEADIRDKDLIHKIFEENHFECVIHLAAKAGVRPSINESTLYMDVNVCGLTQVLEAARKHKVRRFLFASSSSVYGNQEKTPFSESDAVAFPISPYAASKRSGELICHAYHHLYNLEIACLRLFTVYGPRQRPDLAIHKFTELIYQKKPIDVYGTGDSLRDYTYISDIVDGIFSVMQMPGLRYEIFNLGNGRPVYLSELVSHLQKITDQSIQVHYHHKQAGDVDLTHADISKAQQYFGYQPQVSLEDGIKHFLKWYEREF